MNKMKAIKLLFIFLCFVMIATVSVTVFASDWFYITPNTTGNGANTAGTIGGKIVGILRVVGIVISNKSGTSELVSTSYIIAVTW